MTGEEQRIDARAFGKLEAKVEHLVETWKTQDRQATEGRRQLHGKFDELKDVMTKAVGDIQVQVGNLGHRVNEIASDFTKIEPQLILSNNEHQQRVGSKKALAKVWATLIGLVTVAGGVGAAISELVHLLWPVKSHL
jgi:hypothetical protein